MSIVIAIIANGNTLIIYKIYGYVYLKILKNFTQRRARHSLGIYCAVRQVMLLIKETKFSYDCKGLLIFGQADD
jgi:hypothetical protein